MVSTIVTCRIISQSVKHVQPFQIIFLNERDLLITIKNSAIGLADAQRLSESDCFVFYIEL